MQAHSDTVTEREKIVIKSCAYTGARDTQWTCGFSQSVVLPNSVITFEKSFYAHFAKLFSSSLERDIPLCQFHNFSINLKLFQSKNYEMGG